VILHEESCDFSYPKNRYEEFLVRRMRHKQWPNRLMFLLKTFSMDDTLF
jgi:hypothetical protein